MHATNKVLHSLCLSVVVAVSVSVSVSVSVGLCLSLLLSLSLPLFLPLSLSDAPVMNKVLHLRSPESSPDAKAQLVESLQVSSRVKSV